MPAEPGDRPARTRLTRPTSRLAVLLVVAAAAVVVTVPSTAGADGPTSFSNTASIAIPATGSANQIGAASPYPSSVVVSGMVGVVTTVTVTLNSLSHAALHDVDVMLVAPSGENLVVLSDAGEVSPPADTIAANATYTFSDSAGSFFPQSGTVPSGTYRPTNSGSLDLFPAPAPIPSGALTLGSAFGGATANGAWQLFVVDDSTGDVGTMAGGWSLSITTGSVSGATTTVVTTSGTPSLVGESVTFTATVTSGGNPVTGVVQFSDGATSLGPPVLLDTSGMATVSTSALVEGTHQIFAKYTGLGFAPSSGSVTQRVDNQTTVTGNTFCNAAPIGIQPVGAAQPYPSNITVSGLPGPITDMTVSLNGLSHSFARDIDVLLAAPGGSPNLVLMSDVGGTNAVSDADLVFDDDAPSLVPTPITSGSYRPTDDDTDLGDGDADAFPSPAPPVSAATALATFDGVDPNGTWSLYINDDASGDSGSIAGGWCLTIETPPATTTMLTSDLNPSTVGQPVTFTATVTAAGSPVTVGSVGFTADGSSLGGPVSLAPNGTAALTTSSLTAGTHTIVASYAAGTNDFSPSTATLSQVVLPLAAAGGPYTVAEGGALTLVGSGSTTGATYTWDVNGDGVFGDATGVSPTLSWAELEALGIDDGPATHAVTVRATADGQATTATADLSVTNTAPIAVITGALTATVDVPFSLKVGADDPSSADMAATFGYTADWGDGSPIDSVTGPADPSMTHTYGAAGTFSATFVATDKDGGVGGTTVVQVQVSVGTTSPTPPTVPPGNPGGGSETTPGTTTPGATTVPSTTTTAPGSGTTPASGVTTTIASGASTTTPATGTLPATGSDSSPWLVGGAAMMAAAGLVLLIGARRRPTVSP